MPTQKIIAAHLDLSQAEVSKLMAELEIDWKTSSMDQIRVAYIRKLRGVAAGHQSSNGVDLMLERALTERVDREIKAITLAEKRGSVVAIDTLETELAQMIVAMRTELLARDDQLKADLDALYGIDVDLQLLTDNTHAALGHLARYDPERASFAAPAGGSADAAAEDDDDGMGAEAPAPVGQKQRPARPVQP